jgi:2-methylcitrate dehydratase PrpD
MAGFYLFGPLTGEVATGQTVLIGRAVVATSASTSSKLVVQHAAGATAHIVGVTLDPGTPPEDGGTGYDAGELVSIGNIDGAVVLLEVNGLSTNIAVGDAITATTAGVGIKTTTNNNHLIGFALEPATADGVVIKVQLNTGQFGA